MGERVFWGGGDTREDNKRCERRKGGPGGKGIPEKKEN